MRQDDLKKLSAFQSDICKDFFRDEIGELPGEQQDEVPGTVNGHENIVSELESSVSAE